MHLPRSLQAYWGGEARMVIPARSLAEVIVGLSARHDGLSTRIVDEQGRLRRHVSVFVNGASVTHLPPGEVTVRAGDVVHILPAVSGGRA